MKDREGAEQRPRHQEYTLGRKADLKRHLPSLSLADCSNTLSSSNSFLSLQMKNKNIHSETLEPNLHFISSVLYFKSFILLRNKNISSYFVRQEC